MDRTPFLALAAAAVVGGLAGADEACHAIDVPLTPTGWATELDVPRFDPSTGVLTGVELTLIGTSQGAVSIENVASAPTTASTTFRATITLRRPDRSTLVAAAPTAFFVDDLAAFDGVVDFAGASGTTHLGVVASAQQSAFTPAPDDLALFTGDPASPGVIALAIDAVGSSAYGVPGPLVTSFQISASADLVVCYRFEPDCNGNGVPDGEDVDRGLSHDANQDGVPDECQPTTRSVCEGDGAANGGLDCPCLNNGGPGEGCDNGSGSGATLSASGVPSVSADTFALGVSGLAPTTPGFFLFGYELMNGGGGVPFGSGLRCIDLALAALGQGGGGALPAPGSPPLGELLHVQPGATTYFQYWYRNPDGPCGAGANTTNALEVVWGL